MRKRKAGKNSYTYQKRKLMIRKFLYKIVKMKKKIQNGFIKGKNNEILTESKEIILIQ